MYMLNSAVKLLIFLKREKNMILILKYFVIMTFTTFWHPWYCFARKATNSLFVVRTESFN